MADVPKQLLLHVVVGFAACAWSGAATWLILKALDKVLPGGIRVDPLVEAVGLDKGARSEGMRRCAERAERLRRDPASGSIV